MKSFYQLSSQAVAQHLQVDIVHGLNPEAVRERLSQYGRNEIVVDKRVGVFKLFLDQLANPIVIILLVAILIASFTGKTFEAILIGSIVFFMAVIGVFLEKKAGDAVAKLKNLTILATTVIRGGKHIQVDATEVVPGDMLYLHEGDRVPADCRVIDPNELEIDESLLTGESLPARKNSNVIDEEVLIGDQTNMIFAGTFVMQGTVKALVVQTGLRTELGQIAEKIAESEGKETPLQIQLKKLSQLLSIGTLILCAVILMLTYIRGEPFVDGLIQSLSLAIAFIPEGLTAVMTVVLGLGVKEMVTRQVIIKRLLAAEGLGSISILATDKTGTITTGKMTVEKLWVYDQFINARKFKVTNPLEKQIVEVIAYCNNAKGATEQALINFLDAIGVQFELEARAKEHRFSSDIKRMSVIRKIDQKYYSYAKGAPDVLIPLCSQYIDHKTSTINNLSQSEIEQFLEKASALASEGYRVLCLACNTLEASIDINDREQVESNLIFLGLIALIDPLRVEVPVTVAKLKGSGIMPVMITGDHPAIAKTIAIQAGICSDRITARVITGKELDQYANGTGSLSQQAITSCNVFARVTPQHKDLLISLFQSEGKLIAMAGDGINDAIAITKANIGIAVSNATDIIKEAADVVVTGSYDALANAVEVGRLIMTRTRLYLHYLLSGNFCQVGVFILALIFDLPFPLTAVSLLIINLLTDAAPAMAMAVEKGSDTVMLLPPKPAHEGILNRPIYTSIAIQGLISSIFLFIVFLATLSHGLIYAQTATFTAYIFQKLLRGFTARSLEDSVFKYGFLTNKFMLLSILGGLLVWFCLVYIFPTPFQMVSLPAYILLPIVAGALVPAVVEEFFKYFKKQKPAK